jgi:hypothetical protein
MFAICSNLEMTMLTRKIDSALDLIARCRTQIPLLMECFRTGTPEHVALEELCGAVHRADVALQRRGVATTPLT